MYNDLLKIHFSEETGIIIISDTKLKKGVYLVNGVYTKHLVSDFRAIKTVKWRELTEHLEYIGWETILNIRNYTAVYNDWDVTYLGENPNIDILEDLYLR